MRATGTAVAAAWMAGAIASFSTIAIAARALSPAFGTLELMLFRSAIGFAVVALVLAARGRLSVARPRRMGLHALRNIVHFAGQNLWFAALTMLPLAQVFALEFTSPLWVILLAPLLLDERPTRRMVGGGLVGFAGVLLVVRPDLGGLLHPGILAGLGCSVSFAVTAMLTRKLTRTEPVGAVLFWLNAMQLAFSAGLVGVGGGWPIPSAAQLPWVLAIGAAGLAAHWCLTSALDAAPASVVMPMDFLRLPAIAVVGWALYGEPLDAPVFVGAALILGGNALALRPRALPGPQP